MSYPFHDDELEVIGHLPTRSGIMPLYRFPVTMKENVRATLLKEEPVWECLGYENQIFTPRIMPENAVRGLVFEAKPFDNDTQAGGKDMFGIEWEYIPSVGGSMVRPGKPFLEDMYDWEEKIKWPDVDAWDWAGSAEENKEYVKTTRALQVWIQTGWFERLISFMDFEDAIMALFDDDQQPQILAFFDRLADLYINIIDHYITWFPMITSFYMHDDWGSQKETFFSPALVEKMIVPSMRKVTDHIHARGYCAELHSCGQIRKQVPNMIKAGWDTWSGQPMNDARAIYEEYGDQIVVGVIPDIFDPDATTVEEQRERARAFVREYCRPGRPTVINRMGAEFITDAFREEVYKQSRLIYGG
ncbi:MAG: methyltransferase [Lachnospiraceae bacterium]|nr:methyltransferase [Lachnospiraceae bacterium]